MTGRGWLIDKSALTSLRNADPADDWPARIERGLVHIATPTLLEVGYSARSRSDWELAIEGPPIALMPVEYATPRSERRALELQGILATRGQHRAPSIPDLLLAAIAEAASLTLLHLDKDFELIAELTGQPTERLRTG